MRKIMVLTFIFALSFGCSKSEEVKIDNRLEDKIHLVIENYQKKVSDKSSNLLDPPIYEVHFIERGDQCFVVIGTNYFYRTDLDGYKFINNKLITFYSVDSRCNRKLVQVSDKQLDKKLDNYVSEEDAFDNYSPAWWEFELRNNELVVTNQGRHKIKVE